MNSNSATRDFLSMARRRGERRGSSVIQRAFTLIELLVVVAVIAILASLLLPALSRGKLQGYRIKCASNQHQIAVALQLYVDEFHRYPIFGDAQMPPLPPSDLRTIFWDYKVLQYAGNNQGVFSCPAPRGTNNNTTINWSLSDSRGCLWPNRSYGYNAAGVGLEPGFLVGGALGTCSLGLDKTLEMGFLSSLPRFSFLRESALTSPAQMLAVIDYNPAVDDDNDGDFHPDAIYALTLTGAHHNGRANGVFCDAHVEFGRTNVWKAARERWNYDHKPHREAMPYFP